MKNEEIEKLVLENQGFVYSMANKYASSGVPYNDLVASGFLGLVIAAHKFDPTRGSKFISFATSFVQHEMIKTIRETRFPCRIPLNLNVLVNRIRRGEGDEDSPEFATIIPLLRTPETEGSLLSSSYEPSLDFILVDQILQSLDERSRYLVRAFVGINLDRPRTISEIAAEVGLSKQRVRNLIAQGLRRVKEIFERSMV
ncbi:MAG: sigma-70 family RNA polymerase sigma factor [Candidatus Methanomethylicaceae archaeon]